jgi:outer membrane murein-binding lipoprotein Lpp
VLLTGGAAVASLLAGCAGGGAVDEIDANVEEGIDHLEAADTPLASAGDAVHEDDWPACFDRTAVARSEVDAARASFTEAHELAEEAGHDSHATAAQRLLEYIDISESIVDEMDRLCEDGAAGDHAAVEERWETIQPLGGDRNAKLQEVEAPLERV